MARFATFFVQSHRRSVVSCQQLVIRVKVQGVVMNVGTEEDVSQATMTFATLLLFLLIIEGLLSAGKDRADERQKHNSLKLTYTIINSKFP